VKSILVKELVISNSQLAFTFAEHPSKLFYMKGDDKPTTKADDPDKSNLKKFIDLVGGDDLSKALDAVKKIKDLVHSTSESHIDIGQLQKGIGFKSLDVKTRFANSTWKISAIDSMRYELLAFIKSSDITATSRQTLIDWVSNLDIVRNLSDWLNILYPNEPADLKAQWLATLQKCFLFTTRDLLILSDDSWKSLSDVWGLPLPVRDALRDSCLPKLLGGTQEEVLIVFGKTGSLGSVGHVSLSYLTFGMGKNDLNIQVWKDSLFSVNGNFELMPDWYVQTTTKKKTGFFKDTTTSKAEIVYMDRGLVAKDIADFFMIAVPDLNLAARIFPKDLVDEKIKP
jgi:hypothetical protein